MEVRTLAASAGQVRELTARQSVCRACPRLVVWREHVAVERRKAFADEPYWGRPVPGWGDTEPRILVVGLAPAAHGGNRTGRIFTGDRSGDWLFASLNRVGLAALPTSTRAGDGQHLIATRILAAVRCAPPGNAPLPQERDTCSPWFDREVELVGEQLQVVVALGAFAWDAVLASAARSGDEPRGRARRPRFAHGAEADVTLAGRPVKALGCYHPSQQNTFTGRLTAPMLDAVLSRAFELSGQAPGGR
jgi:uracil-DNA glycosylase family 4